MIVKLQNFPYTCIESNLSIFDLLRKNNLLICLFVTPCNLKDIQILKFDITFQFKFSWTSWAHATMKIWIFHQFFITVSISLGLDLFTYTCSENVTATVLGPAKEGTKPAVALRGPPSIIKEVYREIGGASALSNFKSKGKQGEYQIVSDTERRLLVNTLVNME